MKFKIKFQGKVYTVVIREWHPDLNEVMSVQETIDCFKEFFFGARSAGYGVQRSIALAQRETNDQIHEANSYQSFWK